MEKDQNQDIQQPSESQELNTDTTMEKAPRSSEGGTSSKLVWGIVALIVALAVAGGAWMAYSGDGLGSGGDPSGNGAVATVNGEEVSRDKYERRLSQQTQGQESSEVDQQVRDQVLSSLVAEELVLQEAQQAGVSPSEEEIESQLSQARSQFPDDASFSSALDTQGFTEESFRSFVVDQLVIQTYLASEVDVDSITVTEQEIESFYNQSFSGAEDAPALDDVRTQIESQIRTQKQQQLVSEFIDTLRSEAEIEILIQ